MVRLRHGMTHLREAGDATGAPVVLVHGLTTPSFVFDALVPTLVEQGHRVISYDHYGRGLSDRPRVAQTGAFFSDHLLEILEACEVEAPITLVGYSMGGAIVSDFAARHPEKVEALVLIAPAGMRAELGGLTRAAAQVPVLGDILMNAVYPSQHMRGTEAERSLDIAVPNLVDRQQEELAYRGFVAAVLSSLRGVLRGQQVQEHRAIAAAKIPLRAIWGAEDEVIPLSGKDILSQWNSSAQHVVVEGAGHGLTYTHPDQVLAGMREG